jgi:glycosyltransferase involved in cell wall biosynthesis
MGDDITLRDEGWMRKTHATFVSLSNSTRLPFGLGCVAFTDISFSGMPTFPIIHRTHMDIFKGEVVPEIFINQDGDPFLFQLYRRWGTSTTFPCRLENAVGGSVEARYIKKHASNWSLSPLAQADQAIVSYLRNCHGFDELRISSSRKLTVDIVIPCYRVDLYVLSTILSLRVPPATSVNFIIIVDSPDSPYLPALQAKYSHNAQIRIRVNDRNLGASFSRNRGLAEASAEWVHFLDDDVIPSDDLLFATEDAIRANPLAAGFVCNTIFPVAENVFTTAVHISGVTYFWDIATKFGRDVPWGVTANLVSRRVLVSLDVTPDLKIPHPMKFDLSYPKTGGGEDIDYCLSQRAAHLPIYRQTPNAPDEYPGFLPAPKAIVTHPWWNNGKRSYWRFHKWSVGDGHLIDAYPGVSYQDYSPNSAECFLLCALVFLAGGIFLAPGMVFLSLKMALSVFVANVIHDLYRHAFLHPERNKPLNVSPRIRKSYFLWTAAILESSLIRMFSELGRLRGIVEKREWRSIGRRFDWFVGSIPGDMPKKEERRNSLERVGLSLVLCAAMVGPKG